MKIYYYQVDKGKLWENTPVECFESFFSRESAVFFAKKLVSKFGKEVRMTDNKSLYQGSYFRPDTPTPTST